MMKPLLPTEHYQRRDHIEIVHGRSVASTPAVMPWATDAKESIVSMSRRLTTLIINKSRKKGGS